MKKLLVLPVLVGASLVLALPCVLPQLAGMLLLFLFTNLNPATVPIVPLVLPLLVIGALALGNQDVPPGLLYLL